MKLKNQNYVDGHYILKSEARKDDAPKEEPKKKKRGKK